MRISHKPRPPVDCVKTYSGKVRWVHRWISGLHRGEDIQYEAMVLQQHCFDGNGKPFWEDVQVASEREDSK